MKHIYRFAPGIIVGLFLLLFIGFKSPERPWDRIIDGDGKGYYAYLPAIFIYHDLHFNFAAQYEYQYYQGNRNGTKSFRQNVGDDSVNKFFPGLAIIWLPFFFFGHLMAWLEIFPRDGYSLPYQYAIAFSAFLFLWLGARWLLKLLKGFGADDRLAAFIALVVTLGTNLLYYVVVEPSMTHVYSFALITGFMYTTFNLFHDYKPKWFVRSLLLFTLIFLIRPTNGLVILLVPFLAGSKDTLRNKFIQVVSDKKTLWRGLVPALILLMVPIVLWYLQTGSPLVYAYGEEKLNFFHPHMWDILFSFNRGWFIYTPIALITMIGLTGLFRTSGFRFYWLFAFILVFIYMSSCWWIWSYESKCGQRVFVDILGVVALLILFLYQRVDKTVWRKILSTGLIVLIGLNILQFYQHVKWIFPLYNITGEIYKDSFFSFSRKARVYIPDEGIVAVKSMENDMENGPKIRWMNYSTRSDAVVHQGNWSSKVDKELPYSMGLETRIDSMFSTQNRMVRIFAWVFSPREITEAVLVTDYQHQGRSLSYNQFLLEDFVPANKWIPVEVAFYVPSNMPASGTAKIYFYNPSSNYELFVDDLKIDFVSLKNEQEFMKIGGVLLPEEVKW